MMTTKNKESPDWGMFVLAAIIIIPASPFIMSFHFTWLRGWPVAIYHLVLVGIFSSIAYGSWNPEDREMGNVGTYLLWGLLILIDLPISLAVVALWFVIRTGVKSQKHLVATTPTVLFGTIGTYWWYVMPYDSFYLFPL